ncbi:MAG: sensor histidine kinase [Oscillospiraceae bacterium]|nr:sensor histidine kinase [Oscillospiraceae bacterium]
MRNSIVGKIIILFMMMFVLLLTPVVVQSFNSFRQARSYRDLINNIIYANQLNMDVSEKIEPIVWNIVAGKERFEESGIMYLISDIRVRMTEIRNNTSSIENRGIMDISLRALAILENYLNRLKAQIEDRFPVEENERLLEEIRVCVAGVNDLLQEFSSKQVGEASVLNQTMSRQSNRNFIINLSLTCLAIFTGIFAFWYISGSIMSPIEKLLSMSNKISEGDFSFRIQLAASDEFNDLAAGMNIMSEKIELLLEKGIEEQKQLQVMEHKVLQAQITPHFLYNTLDAIIWAAEADNMSDVIKLVTSLSSFFRTSLSGGSDLIPIANEIEHVRNYLIIQQMRYNDILTYEIDVDEDLQNRNILKLSLQPLVENSLYHGIKNTRERGIITVSVKKEGRKVRFTVADNGIGMTPDELSALRNEINFGSGEKGYGLFNVNRRLKLYYDLPDGIEIESEYKKGAKVSFLLEL